MPTTVTIPTVRINHPLITHTAVFILAVVLTHFAPHLVHPEKHTGPMTLKLVDQRAQKQYWARSQAAPSKDTDVVVMEWDGTMPQFAVGLAVKDLTYTDDNQNVRHFVKATF